MVIEKRKEFVCNFLSFNYYVKCVLLAIVTIIFTVILYPNLVITNHNYQVGDIAERDIKAPKNLFIEDIDATEMNRKQAVEKVLTVYDHDVTLSSILNQHVKEAFSDLRSVLEIENENKRTNRTETSTPSTNDMIKEETFNHNPILNRIGLLEEKMGITVGKGAYTILENEKFSENISNFIIRILTQILDNGVVTNKDIFLRESEKGIILRVVGTHEEKTVMNLKQFYGLDQAKTMVRIIGQPVLKDLNYSLRNLIVDFVQQLLQPNITLNKSESEERKQKAASQVKPILYKIKAGEMLLREGERVTEVQLLKLKALQTQIKKGQILVSSIGAGIMTLYLLMITYILHTKNQNEVKSDQNRNLLFMACIFIAFLLLTKVSVFLSESLAPNAPFAISATSISFGIPLASAAMTICLFIGLDIAIPFALVMAACVAPIFEYRFEFFLYFLLSSQMAAYWIQQCRERKVFVKAGVKLGILNTALAIAINVYMTDFFGFKILWNCAFAFMGGFGAGILTAGIAPLVEIAFDFTTDIKLLELANLDRPILRRLMIQAPGTYHHSVIVGSMVEAAAAEIGANSLLAKVCGYYHDIGKIKKPLYFIENQVDAKNKHDKLAPSMSSLILISHIKDGVEIAKQNKLGQVIIDTIRQHHGTSLIKFFYEKAKQLKGEDTVKIDGYRYPGPKPQTKEAGLVMLADVVEAASRSLENPTPSRIQGLVQNLINKVFSDGQLDNCELTLRDLHNIAKSFNKILNGIYHHRIEYTENAVVPIGKKKNVSSDRQQAKQTQSSSGKDTATSTGRLKRLGLS